MRGSGWNSVIEKPIKILLRQKRSKWFSIKEDSNVIEVLNIVTINGYFMHPCPPTHTHTSSSVKARFSPGNRLHIKPFCSAWVKIGNYWVFTDLRLIQGLSCLVFAGMQLFYLLDYLKLHELSNNKIWRNMSVLFTVIVYF